MRLVKSCTAEKHGYGSMPWRWVSGLTAGERDAVRNGDIVYFEINKTSYMQSGFKIVTHSDRGWDCREPNAIELENIKLG